MQLSQIVCQQSNIDMTCNYFRSLTKIHSNSYSKHIQDKLIYSIVKCTRQTRQNGQNRCYDEITTVWQSRAHTYCPAVYTYLGVWLFFFCLFVYVKKCIIFTEIFTLYVIGGRGGLIFVCALDPSLGNFSKDQYPLHYSQPKMDGGMLGICSCPSKRNNYLESIVFFRFFFARSLPAECDIYITWRIPSCVWVRYVNQG